MARPPLSRLSIALVLCVGLLGLESCSGQPAPGEMLLLVSTDLSIPTDADTLHVTVTRTGETDPFLEDFYPLGGDAAVHLPGTVALVARDKARGVVKVHAELLQSMSGAANKAVRVQRDAELELPSAGVKQLPMALDFLCAEGSLPSKCPAGQTCEVGQCIDDKIADSAKLADYVAVPAADCFDVRGCFSDLDGSNTTVPQVDVDEHHGCSVKTSQVGNAQDVNVALIVKTMKVGNYGVCDAASGRCFIPLAYGPSGWQTLTDSSQRPIAIGFPDAICAELSTGIAGVAITPTSPSCPPRSASASLCPAPSTCVATGGIGCPSKFSGFSCSTGICPPDWSSSYCSGGSSTEPAPASSSSRLCGALGRDPQTGPLVPGLWCCGDTDPPPGEDPLLIDDMSSGPFTKLKPPDGEHTGVWYSACDDINADISPPVNPALFSYRTIDPPATPAGGPTISHAACLRSDKGIAGYVALEGFNFFSKPPSIEAPAVDLSPYSGISFWANAAPGPIVDETGAPLVPTSIRVNFPDSNTDTEHPDSACVQGGRATCDQFGKVFTLTTAWTKYFVRWDQLAQGGYGMPFANFNRKAVYSTGFLFLGPGEDSVSLPFDFCVAQIEFTQD
jgi:hypothetical protein